MAIWDGDLRTRPKQALTPLETQGLFAAADGAVALGGDVHTRAIADYLALSQDWRDAATQLAGTFASVAARRCEQKP